MENDDRMLSPREVAQIFGVCAKTITRWDKAGKLNSTRTLGGHRRFLKSEVESAMTRKMFPNK